MMAIYSILRLPLIYAAFFGAVLGTILYRGNDARATGSLIGSALVLLP